MTDETAKQLAEAMNNLAEAINRLTAGGGLLGGIRVYHIGLQQPQQMPFNAPQQPWVIT